MDFSQRQTQAPDSCRRSTLFRNNGAPLRHSRVAVTVVMCACVPKLTVAQNMDNRCPGCNKACGWLETGNSSQKQHRTVGPISGQDSKNNKRNLIDEGLTHEGALFHRSLPPWGKRNTRPPSYRTSVRQPVVAMRCERVTVNIYAIQSKTMGPQFAAPIRRYRDSPTQLYAANNAKSMLQQAATGSD